MIKTVTIIGFTGHGKTFSPIVPPDGIIKEDEYNGLNLNETVLYNIDKKTIPFLQYKKFTKWKDILEDFEKTKIRETDIDDDFFNELELIINNKPNIKNIIIDTFSLGMFEERMKKEHQSGFDKWSKLMIKFWNLLDKFRKMKGRDDLIVWIFYHPEKDIDREGNTIYRAKVEGKGLSYKPEEVSTNIFFAHKKGKNNYIFETQSEQTTAKNPPLLFNDVIPNSLKLIRDTLINGKSYM